MDRLKAELPLALEPDARLGRTWTMTWTTDGMLGHVEWLPKIPGEPPLPLMP